MFGIEALDVVIGLIFIYLLFSLFVTIVNEMIVSLFQIRGKELQFFILQMIGPYFLEKFFDHPRIKLFSTKSPRILGRRVYDMKSLSLPKEKKPIKGILPSEILATDFAKTLIEVLLSEADKYSIDKETPLESIFEKLIKQKHGYCTLNCILRNNDNLAYLFRLIKESNNSIPVLTTKIERWYEEMMLYATDWYKRKLRWFLFFIGLLITMIFNVDSIKVFQELKNNPGARAAIVQQAEGYIASHGIDQQTGLPILINGGNDTTEVKGSLGIRLFMDSQFEYCKNQNKEEAVCKDSLKQAYPTFFEVDSTLKVLDKLIQGDINKASVLLGMGWELEDDEYLILEIGKTIVYFWKDGNWKQILGWIITAIALSMGAPFWFDLLRKVVNIKNELKGKSKSNDGAVG